MSPTSHLMTYKKALPLLLLFAGLFFVNFASRVILGPFLPLIEVEFGLDHAQAGGLMGYIALGMSLSMIFSGLAARVFKHRGTILVSTAAIGLSLVLVALSTDLFWLRASLFLTGLSGGLYFPSAISSITSFLEPRHWGKGIATHELAPNTAFIAIPAVGALLEGIVPWRGVFGALGALGLAMAALFFFKGRGGDFRGQPPKPSVVFSEVLSRPIFWVLAYLFSVAIGASFGPYSMLPLYLTDELGMDLEEANALLVYSRLGGPFIALGTGFIVDRIGALQTATLALGSTGIFTVLLGLTSGTWLNVAVVLQPTLAVCFFSAGITAVSLVFPEEVRNLAVSFIVPVAIFIGSGVVPPVLGWFGDHGQFTTGFICLGAIILTGLIPLAVLRYQKKKG